MSQTYASVYLRISPEAKTQLEAEVERRKKRGLPHANQSQLIQAICLALNAPAIQQILNDLGTPQATAQAKR